MSRWLVVLVALLGVGFFVYQRFPGTAPEAPLVKQAEPSSSAISSKPSEDSESASSSAISSDGSKEPVPAAKSETSASSPDNNSVNPFVIPPGGVPDDTDQADMVDEVQGEDTAEDSSDTTRDLLQEVPDSYPIENAEAYYVPPEERYPGHLGGPPPLKLPPINADDSESPSEEPGEESEGGFAPPTAP
jgi:hypothetical protein